MIPPDVFLRARAAFAAAGCTLRNERRDFPEWHLGRPRYALWALELEEAEVGPALAAARHGLAGLLLAGYCRQPHVTLGLCGFPTPVAVRDDDFGPEALAAQVAALSADAPGPFTLAVGRLGSFTSAPFLEVADVDGGIGVLRSVLAGGEAPGASGAYTPHLTVGLFAEAWPVAEVLGRMDAVAGGPPVVCRVARVSLLSYAAAEIGGPLQREASFDLVSRRLTGVAQDFCLAPASPG